MATFPRVHSRPSPPGHGGTRRGHGSRGRGRSSWRALWLVRNSFRACLLCSWHGSGGGAGSRRGSLGGGHRSGGNGPCMLGGTCSPEGHPAGLCPKRASRPGAPSSCAAPAASIRTAISRETAPHWPADDFNAQPWVIPVAACGLNGGWYRVHRHPLGRQGPSVELCAPGELVTFPEVGAADDSSLAAALVAGTAARHAGNQPRAEQHRAAPALRATAVELPSEENPSTPGLEATCFNEWDRTGHNFKLGYGRIDTAGACLAAADPVCYALLATRCGAPAQLGSGVPRMEAVAAGGWEDCLMSLVSHSELARRYLALRGHLVPLVLRSPELRDALFWLARHFRALRQYGPKNWPEDGTDHGSLSDRCLYVLETLSDSLDQRHEGVPGTEIAEWLHETTQFLNASSPQALARFFARALVFAASRPS